MQQTCEIYKLMEQILQGFHSDSQPHTIQVTQKAVQHAMVLNSFFIRDCKAHPRELIRSSTFTKLNFVLHDGSATQQYRSDV